MLGAFKDLPKTDAGSLHIRTDMSERKAMEKKLQKHRKQPTERVSPDRKVRTECRTQRTDWARPETPESLPRQSSSHFRFLLQLTGSVFQKSELKDSQKLLRGKLNDLGRA